MPRRKEVAIKNPQPPTPPAFHSEEARERFEKIYSNKQCVGEKGFILHDEMAGYPAYITDVIRSHGWQKLCTHRKTACNPVVKEFYANLTEKYQDAVYVRGEMVPIDSYTINQCCQTGQGYNEHFNFMNEMTEEKFQGIVADLCVENTKIIKSAHGALTFPRNSLKPPAKVWYHFLKSSLMPTGHLQSVTQERALLLHSILFRRKINIGRILLEQICEHSNKQSGKIHFPCLITELCERAGVFIEEGDEELVNSGAITPLAIQRITHEEGGQGVSSDGAGPSTAPAAAPVAPENQELREIKHTLNTMLEEQRRHHRRDKAFWVYMRSWNRAFQQNQSASITPLHTYPRFPAEILEDTTSSEED